MIDAMDKKLVRSLNANARKSFREIAKELGTSTTSVIRGIKKLESSGAVRGYIPVVDPAAFGYDLTVVVLDDHQPRPAPGDPAEIAQDHHVPVRPGHHRGMAFAPSSPTSRPRG